MQLIPDGGGRNPPPLKIAFPVQIFPRFSTQGFPRLFHAWFKRNLCKKVHFSTYLDSISMTRGTADSAGTFRPPPIRSKLPEISSYLYLLKLVLKWTFLHKFLMNHAWKSLGNPCVENRGKICTGNAILRCGHIPPPPIRSKLPS